MSDLVGLMQARFRRLVLDFETTFSAQQVSHAGERGRLLEETLKSFLSTYLPKRIAVGSGQIVGAIEKKPSKQVDIVLYDSLNFPLLLDEGAYQLFPNEAVLAIIEVKSLIDQKGLKDGIENIVSSKSLHKFPPKAHPKTLGIIFGYRTGWKRPKSLFRNLHNNCCNFDQKRTPDLICSLEPGYLLASTSSLGESVSRLNTLVAGRETNNQFPPDKFVLIRPLDFSKEHVLLWFYLLLIDYLNRTLNIGVNMSQYIKASSAWQTDVIDLDEYTAKKSQG